MMQKILILLLILFTTLTILHAADNNCYQKPDKCAAGDVLILSLSEDVAKYCDFEKQIVNIGRRSVKSSFINRDVVCVKDTTPRKELK